MVDIHIPHDICREILLRSPAKSLIRFRAVCKSWHAVIDDRSFVKALTNKQLSCNTILIRRSTGPPSYTLDLEALNFTNGSHTLVATPIDTRLGFPRLSYYPLASCKGLMLIFPHNKKNWEIWNPLTHERLELPHVDFNSDVVGLGLGYDYATGDYKVVLIVHVWRLRRGRDKFHPHVYSLRYDTWRKIGNCPLDYRNWTSISCGPGAFLNGALHWVSSDALLVLDLGTENYRHLKLIPVQFRGSNRWIQLNVLDGCLIMSDDECKSDHFDVWVMKDYGVHDSWTKLFSVMRSSVGGLVISSLRPVSYIMKKMQIFLHDRSGLYLFDVESCSLKCVSICGFTRSLSAQSFQGSIFRLHDNCGVSGSASTERRIRELKREIAMPDTKLMFCVRDIES